MSVQTEIARIAQAKTDIKNVVNSKVANTITNQTIDAFPPLIDSSIAAYKNLIPWIEGSGSNFTIDNAEAGKLDLFEMEGNTHQDSYTGKNLYYIEPQTKNGVTLSYDSDGAIVLNGTSNASYIEFQSIVSLNGTYNLSVSNPTIQSDTYVRTRNRNGTLVHTITLSDTDTKNTNKTSDIAKLEITIGARGITFNNFKIYVQLESGSTATDYEPYCGGTPSPNPDYPQEVKVVENEQIVNVSGKNLNKTSIIVNLTSGSEKWIGTRLDEVKWENGKTYYIKAFLEKQSNESVQITNYGYKNIDNKRDTIVFNGNVPYVRVGANTLNTNVTNEEVKIMVSTETFTDFEPYQSKDYEIDLHGKNLIEGSNDFSGVWNNSQNWETDNNSYNNLIVKKNQGTWNGINKEIYITAGTYTFSLFAKSDSARTANIYLGGTLTTDNLVPQSKQLNLTTEWQRYDVTFTSNANGTIKPRLENPTVISNNYTYICGYQLEENSTATDYEEFYDYKLCKIGDYKDSIKKSTGKNLFDLTNIENNGTGRTTYTIENDNIVMTATSSGTYRYIYKTINNLTIGQEYTIKINYHNDTSTNKIAQWGVVNSQGNYYVYVRNLKDIQKLIFTPTETSATFRAGYLENICNANDILTIGQIQLEQNSQATEYEPYGEQWYIKKAFGKVVLDGSGNTELYGNGGTATDYWEYFRANLIGGVGTAITVFSNYFNQTTNSRVVIIKNGTLYLRFPKASGIDVSTNTLLNTWLSTHNTIVYYVLATPTTTEITNSTLINQLEAIETKTGTNIFEVSNDNDVLPNLYILTEKQDSYKN